MTRILISKPFLSRTTLGFPSAAFLLIGGIAMMGVGMWFFFDNARFVSHAQRAQGVVEDVVGRRGARGQTLYYPVVRYRPPAASPTSSSRQALACGRRPSPSAIA